MAAVANTTSANFQVVNKKDAQTVSSKLSSAAQATQKAAATALSGVTHPVFVYFLISNAALARMNDTATVNMIGMNVVSSFAGISAAMLAGFCRQRATGSPGIKITIKSPENSETRNNSIIPITSNNFKSEVLESKTPVVLFAWDTQCKHLESMVEQCNQQNICKVAVLNVDEEQTLAKELNVGLIPSCLLFKNGQIVDRISGALGDQAFNIALKEKLVKLLS